MMGEELANGRVTSSKRRVLSLQSLCTMVMVFTPVVSKLITVDDSIFKPWVNLMLSKVQPRNLSSKL